MVFRSRQALVDFGCGRQRRLCAEAESCRSAYPHGEGCSVDETSTSPELCRERAAKRIACRCRVDRFDDGRWDVCGDLANDDCASFAERHDDLFDG